MKELLLIINVFCSEYIDPKFDKHQCVESMEMCMENKSNSFDDCADFYDH